MRFLVVEGWLAHWLDFAGERILAADAQAARAAVLARPGDPHRMAAAIQILTRRTLTSYAAVRDHEWRSVRAAGACLGPRRSTRRRRGHQPRAGGRRGDRADQADPEGVAGGAEGDRCRLQKSSPIVRDAPGGGTTMRARAVVLAVAIVLAPLGARAADLVVWWEKGYYAQEDEALREIVAAFEQKTGKRVELDLLSAGRAAGQARGGARGRQAARLRLRRVAAPYIPKWALRGSARRPHGHGGTLLRPVRPGHARRGHLARRARPGSGPSTALPMGVTNHVHVWKSLLEQAGFTLADIPKEWDAFWSFWCDRCSRRCARPLGREDVWGVGLPMSVEAYDTTDISASSPRLPGGLRDPRRPARHRRSGVRRRLSRRSTAIPPSIARAARRPIR